jgi:hypothetical protein
MAARGDRPEPFMVRGALFTLRRRCGKPSCHCARESGHESPALAYPEGGRTRTMTLSARAALDARADAGVAVIRARLTQRRLSR